ncbi:MAG TPA: serpin family protein [Nocardioides sp.]|uniref:serpin family protein n=1 Tax=Nocardioides sp. TaxID=35761 RepID=UPI002F40CE61
MLSRRETLRALGAAGVAAPVLAACGDADPVGDPPASDSGLRLVKADVSRSAGDASAVADVVAAMGAFATDLWQQVGDTDDNLALSPCSIATALAMTANGAAGATASQMLDVLHVDSLSTYNAGMAALTQELAALAGPVRLRDGKNGTISLTSADQLFGDRSMTWRRAFLTVLAKQYGAGMYDVDFLRNAEGARAIVNHWTAGRTHDRIPEILPEGAVDASTRLVLVNALYFKAPWDIPFEKAATTEAAFHRAGGSTVQVPMMHGDAEGSAVYLEGRHFTGARLPYRSGTLAMTVALPTADHDAALAELLGRGGLTATSESPVAVTMPRWRYRIPTDLRGPLMSLGLTDAFDDGRADFSRMTSDERLHVSSVLHQTFVAVDEDGTEAAAATAVAVADSAVAMSHTLVLDRPYLFVVHDTAHGTPLFVGRVADPG